MGLVARDVGERNVKRAWELLGLSWVVFFFYKQKTAYDFRLSLVGSEMCRRGRVFRLQRAGHVKRDLHICLHTVCRCIRVIDRSIAWACSVCLHLATDRGTGELDLFIIHI